MLAAAKADFKVHGAIVAEQLHTAKLARFGHRNLRQKIVDQISLFDT
jgi:hypothetical protein